MALLLDNLSVYGEMLEAVLSILHLENGLAADDVWARVFPLDPGAQSHRELLSYLLGLNLVTVNADNMIVESGDTRLPLRLRILASLNMMADENRVILDCYRWLLESADSHLPLLSRDDVWPKYNRIQDTSRGIAAILNSPKMASWLRLMSYLELIRPERSNTFVLVPSLRMTWTLLEYAARDLPSPIPFAQLVQNIEQRWCPLARQPGAIYPGFASALELLRHHGAVAFERLGDAETLTVEQQQVSYVTLHPGAWEAIAA